MKIKINMKPGLKKFLTASVSVIMVGMVLTTAFNPTIVFSLMTYVKIIGYSLFYGLSLWYGNAYLVGFISKKYVDWNKLPLKSFLITSVTVLIYSSAATVLINYIWVVVILRHTYSDFIEYQMSSMITEIIVAVFITTFFYAIKFFKSWKEVLINEEQLKNEAISLRYEALKNQVNPHFLFNSLNTLTNIVQTDPDLAVKFIKQLSEIYRYVLEQKDTELVDLDTEMKFVQSYLYLLQIRFSEKLILDVRVTENLNYKVIPISIQILLENAVKHNEISSENPLKISIFIDESNNLVVKNNLQTKSTINDSTQIGLSNLKSRYEYLTGKTFEIIKTDEEFIVKLPLINK
jgi:sensor histidine kinase YesM